MSADQKMVDVRAIVQEIRRSHFLCKAFSGTDNGPAQLMPRLKRAHDRKFLTVGELTKIAVTKLSGLQGKEKVADRVKKNSHHDVMARSKAAFAAETPEEAVRPLKGLKGIGVATASAALAWCFPEKWPVIDRRGWATLQQFDLLGDRTATTTFSVDEYGRYCRAIGAICKVGSWDPQQVDRWLYAFDRCGLKAGDTA